MASRDPSVSVVITPGLGGIRTRIVLGEDGATAVSSVFTLCNSAIGAGVLSLPFAFMRAGLVGCFLLCVVLGLAEAFTLYVLSKFAERYDAHSYGSLVRKALGKKLSGILSTILLIYLWGSCIAYLVIVGDTFSSLVYQQFGDILLADRRLLITGFGLLVILPLCFPRNLSALEWISLAAVIGFVYTAVVIVIRGSEIVADRQPHFAGVKLFELNYGMLFAIPIVVFGFNCHPNVVSIFSELQEYPHRIISALPGSPRGYTPLHSLAPKPRSHKLIGMLGVIASATTLIMVGYLAVGMVGYLAYTDAVSSNILNTLPPDDTLMKVARCVIGCVVVGHYPLNHHPARLCVEDLLHVMLDWTSIPFWLSALITLGYVVSTIAVAVLVQDLGSVLHMIGGTVASMMIFLLPGLILINSSIAKESARRAPSSLSLADGTGDSSTSIDAPLLAETISKKAGLRESGLIYSPAKSWWAGIACVVLSLIIFTITIVTAIKPS